MFHNKEFKDLYYIRVDMGQALRQGTTGTKILRTTCEK